MIYYFFRIGGIKVKKLLRKVVELYAKNSTNSCIMLVFHQPKAPRCIIEK